MTDRRRAPLRIAVTQPRCLPYDVMTNADTHATTIRSAKARVVVFPELSLTGYELDAPPLAGNDPRLAPIIDACAEMGSVALVGAPTTDAAGRPHISVLAVQAGRIALAYNKIWLGSRESERFVPGDEPAVVEVDGWRLGLAICKDTSIPQHQMDTAALGIDAYVAGTLMFSSETGEQNERARRIATDHDAWVALASFAGSTGDGYDKSAGCSGIWRRDGVVVTQAGPNVGEIARATLQD